MIASASLRLDQTPPGDRGSVPADLSGRRGRASPGLRGKGGAERAREGFRGRNGTFVRRADAEFELGQT